METKRELRQQLTESVIRETEHFIALEKIEKIIEQSDKSKEPFVFVIDKIKKVLAAHFQTNS